MRVRNHRMLAIRGKLRILTFALSISLSSLATDVSFAQLVSEGTARQTAETFLFSQKSLQEKVAPHGAKFHYAKKAAAELEIIGTTAIRDDDATVLAYVHELAPQGFIITSGDSRVRGVLGYSWKGKFAFEDAKDNVLLHLIKWDVEARLKALEASGRTTRSLVSANKTGPEDHGRETYMYLAEDLRNAAASTPEIWGPLLQTSWDQWEPYNATVPLVEPGFAARRPVGCVATAISQIINYWRYPSSVSFDSRPWPIGDAYTNCIPFLGDQIRFDADADTYDFPNFSELNDRLANIDYDQEIAYLTFAAGLKLDTCYGRNASSARVPFKVGRVLTHDFSFGSAVEDNWFPWPSKRTRAIENIQNGWPVLISIAGSIWSLHSHAVVIDGYKSTGEFHVNLGWGGRGGTNDCWYSLPDIETWSGYPGPYHVIIAMVYDIARYQGWNQYGGDEKNSFGTVYTAPTIDLVRKWSRQCPSGYYFGDLVIGTGNKIYASCSRVGSGGTPYIHVINSFGDLENTIPISVSGNIESVAQNRSGAVFVATEHGQIHKVDTETDTASPIWVDPNGDDIYSLKVDEDGYLYAMTLNNLYRLNSLGAVQWPFHAPSGTIIGSTSNRAPAIDSARERVYVTYYDPNAHTAHFAALDRQSGHTSAEKIFQSISVPIFRIPSVASDGTIYLKIYDMLYALDPSNISGSPRWCKSGNFTNTPAIGKDGTLYVTDWQGVGGVWYNRLVALNPANGSEKYSVSFQLDIDTEDIFQPYVDRAGVVLFAIELNGTPRTYHVYAYRDTGSGFTRLWEYNAGTSAGDFAFGPGQTVYVWGKTGLADTLYAISEGDVGDPYGAGMDYANNQPPASPSSPFPSYYATDVGTNVTLSWASSDPDGHTLKYDLYLAELTEGQEASLNPVATQLTTGSYNLTGLPSDGTQYLWAVVATDGQSVAEGPTWSFTTVNDPPSVLTVTPAAGSTNVAANTAITAEFSESLDATTINASTFFLNNGVTGTVSYDPDTKIATFTPYSDLAYSTPYTATITTGVKDLLGAGMAEDYSWSFTTAEAPAPRVNLSPLTLSFSNQLRGTTSGSQPVTLTNNGDATLHITSIGITGANPADFAVAATTTCPAAGPVMAGANCRIDVTFTPTAAGSRSATLTATDDDKGVAGSMQTVSLTGTGTDFALGLQSGGSTSATVNAGQTATYNLQIAPTGFSGNVAMSCSWTGSQPRGTNCTISPTSVNLDGTTAAPFTVTVTTMARSLAGPGPNGWPPVRLGHRIVPLAVWLLGLIGLMTVAAARRRRVYASLAGSMLLVLLWAACGGGGGGGGGTTATGTPAGTYTLTMTATAAGVSRTTSLTLKVN